ncbi:MAG: AAA family ATPase [Sedimentisphaerales bacterium]|nr:AAA family ATPase [Sedimentisphaerales bacterium]
MLLEFRVKNFRSFREEQTLSLVASNDKCLSENTFTQGSYSILKAAGIYGPNASGKSNLIKAFKTMQDIVIDSADYKPGQKLPVIPFLFDKASKEQTSDFEVIFFVDKVRYQYGFSATPQKIKEEWLYAFPNEASQTWFLRKSDRDKWKFGSYFKGEKKTLKEKTRENALFVSVGAQWNHEQLTAIYNWFKNCLRIVTADYIWPPVTEAMLSELENNDQSGNSIHSTITDILQKADFGITDYSVEKIDPPKILFPADIPVAIKEKILKQEREKRAVHFFHVNERDGVSVKLPMEEESDGTKRFFNLLGPWVEVFVEGYTIFFDELESHLHPLLTRELIKFIQNEKNTKGAQLIFATHDTTLLDPELLRRDQIWFTEKSEEHATCLYSLAEYKTKARKGEAMQKRYLAGRYGAIPILEAFSIDD